MTGLIPLCVWPIVTLCFYQQFEEVLSSNSEEVPELTTYVNADIVLNVLMVLSNVLPICCPSKSTLKAYLFLSLANLIACGCMVNWGFDLLYSEEFVMNFMRSGDEVKMQYARWLYAFL